MRTGLFLNNFLTFLTGLFILIYIPTVSGQSFVNINANLSGLSNSSAAWGDFDNDKDLDLVISGEASDGSMNVKLYRNTEGIFEEVSANFIGIKNGSVDWSDYDNDGDLDLLVTGDNDLQQTFIYKNENYNFINIIPGFLYFGPYSYAIWCDYDNDGDLDAFITGGWSSILYRNDGQDVFTDTGIDFKPLISSRACWEDYDKDGDSDLLLTGDTGGGMKLFLYNNNDGEFEEIELENMGLSSGSVEWGDYDNDGDLDILITGHNDNVEPDAIIYRNDGNHIFTDIYAGLPPVVLGNASWGDADNDGDLDVAITGKLAGCGATASAIYENLGNDIFNDISAFLTNAERSTVCWGDYDNDTDLDLFLSGKDYYGNSFSKIYRNDFGLPNLLPSAPANLAATIHEDSVVFTWDPGADPQTPQSSLTYNIRIGTYPSENNVIDPMSHIEDGYRKIVKSGNFSSVNFIIIKGLEPGITYYWSVQTIDHTFAGSPFSEEQSFYLNFTSVNKFIDQNEYLTTYPNPAKSHIQFFNSDHDELLLKVIVSNVMGKQVYEGYLDNKSQLDVSTLNKGLYILRFFGSNRKYIRKLLIE